MMETMEKREKLFQILARMTAEELHEFLNSEEVLKIVLGAK